MAGDEQPGVEWMFYDGHCGLCHGFVRFVLARDHRHQPFQFAPLDGDVFRRAVAGSQHHDLPDSIVVLTRDGMLLTRSAAVLHVAGRLGGVWTPLAAVGRLVPAVVRDAVYRLVARVRSRLFAKPPDICPVVPAHLRSRFGR